MAQEKKSKKSGIERAMLRLASFQYKHYKKVVIVSLLLTVFFAFGALTQLEFEGDSNKEMPQDHPTFALNNKVNDKFPGDVILTVVTTNEGTGSRDIIYDVRDPKVILSVVDLANQLDAESNVDSVVSVAPLFEEDIPPDLEGVKERLALVPSTEELFNDDYSITLVAAILGQKLTETDDIGQAMDMITTDIAAITKPAGVDYPITGLPPITYVIVKIMAEDLVLTTTVAALLILVLLRVVLRSSKKAILVFIPLVFGILWTFGIMAFAGIKVSIASVGIGAIIVGLATEYGIFMVTNYFDARKQGKSAQESLNLAVGMIGTTTFSSALTTTAAFLALTISIIPMLQHLGETLALGIVCCWVNAVIINPCFIMFQDRK